MAMIWRNLKSGKCPNCSHALNRFEGYLLKCDVCEFTITDRKRKEILENIEAGETAKVVALAEEVGQREKDYWDDPDIL